MTELNLNNGARTSYGYYGTGGGYDTTGGYYPAFPPNYNEIPL
jgi:hypothetical protein